MKRIFIFAPIAVVLTSLLYFVFFGDDIVSSKNREDETLRSGLSKRTVVLEEESMFESGTFLDFSGSAEPETTAQNETDANSDADSEKRKVGGIQGLSPEEKEKLRKEMIQRAKPLAERFPNNALIPRELGKEQEEKRKKEEERMGEIRAALLEGREVPKSEMSFYLETKIKRSDDMTEILSYGLKLFKENPRNNYPAASLTTIEERLSSLQKSKDELLSAKKNLEQTP
ncbi:hypothetical protein EHQ12_18575 [Leptospira gomenensis]|uniref:Uncharacterized protein n=1 Tax=Leptospira gomenensis TaxID=2484974 RepID=A0A5F1YXM7_9LEPT|nr:hypothetical protein [Leptospira gomenensis]TGK32611.1 hypothetical protein EHQ12_18575 [Leptospira gomenensis]TGK38341.1 hypothetical protein EHQ17_01450 [Leptospira gomenensis]TGK52155.1 hypothetical protein EHQ07_00875 [Leptospira gomenensis]TGK62991.1 hypothetical protein EHQ13_08110 [Leptospira gomenensis]